MVNLVELQRESERIAPDARIEERLAVLDRLDIIDADIVCDVPAWGGYFSRGVSNPQRIICLDPTPGMVNCPGAKIVASSPWKFSAPTACADKVASLVGMHHISKKQMFVSETFRILKSSGLAVLSEVLQSSPVAAFLNEDVNKYSERGHVGLFLEAGDLKKMLDVAGYIDSMEMVVDLHWQFDSISQMVAYCKALFAMTKATDREVQTALESRFAFTATEGSVRLPWSLVYGVGRKASVR